jgi:DNA polymerase-3 subunit epsilon
VVVVRPPRRAGHAVVGRTDEGLRGGGMRQVFLDTETTGLSAEQGDRIVEIGCIEMVNRRLSGRTLHHYVNPGRPSHPDALKVHGLTDEFLADKPAFAQIAAEIAEFIGGAELIIHNAEFDVGFLDAEFERLGHARVSDLVGAVTDSLALARELFPGKGNSLDALCKRLEVDNSAREVHGALLDAGLLAEVYLRMTRGQKALVIDAGDEGQGGAVLASVDLSVIVLPIVEPTPEELAAHLALLADLDKASGGKTLYRSLAPA